MIESLFFGASRLGGRHDWLSLPKHGTSKKWLTHSCLASDDGLYMAVYGSSNAQIYKLDAEGNGVSSLGPDSGTQPVVLGANSSYLAFVSGSDIYHHFSSTGGPYSKRVVKGIAPRRCNFVFRRGSYTYWGGMNDNQVNAFVAKISATGVIEWSRESSGEDSHMVCAAINTDDSVLYVMEDDRSGSTGAPTMYLRALDTSDGSVIYERRLYNRLYEFGGLVYDEATDTLIFSTYSTTDDALTLWRYSTSLIEIESKSFDLALSPSISYFYFNSVSPSGASDPAGSTYGDRAIADSYGNYHLIAGNNRIYTFGSDLSVKSEAVLSYGDTIYVRYIHAVSDGKVIVSGNYRIGSTDYPFAAKLNPRMDEINHEGFSITQTSTLTERSKPAHYASGTVTPTSSPAFTGTNTESYTRSFLNYDFIAENGAEVIDLSKAN